MTTATRTTETATATIKITLTREVTEKVAYLDGYNLPAGNETYENYEVKLTSKRNGAAIQTDGKPGGFAFFAPQGKYSGKYPAGAYARVGDAYISKEVYDIAITMIAELDAELTPDQNYIETKSAEVAQEQADDQAIDNEAAEYANQVKSGLCPKCGTYCYGDCESN